LLAAASIAFDSGSGVIDITGSGKDDAVEVSETPGNRITVRVQTGSKTKEKVFDHSKVNKIRFGGGEGDDVFVNNTSIRSKAYGGIGNDLIIGGTARDHLYGGWGDDMLFGGGADDVLKGSFGNDVLDGQKGNDELFGGWGRDELYGGAGKDKLYGSRGSDLLSGGSSRDHLEGGSGDDVLLGGSGGDKLYGNAGRDILKGGSGKDKLRGGRGRDRLYGGGGNGPSANEPNARPPARVSHIMLPENDLDARPGQLQIPSEIVDTAIGASLDTDWLDVDPGQLLFGNANSSGDIETSLPGNETGDWFEGAAAFAKCYQWSSSTP